MTSNFHSTINCSLRTPLLQVNISWNVTLNGRDLLDDEMSTFGLSVYDENDILILNGTINIDQASTLDITCEVSNIHGNDTRKTSISLCSKCLIVLK